VRCNRLYCIDIRFDAIEPIASPFWFDAIRTIASSLCLMQFELLHRLYVWCNSNYCINTRLDAIQTITSTWGWMQEVLLHHHFGSLQYELLHRHEIGRTTNYCIGFIAQKFIKLQNSMAQKGNHINNLDHKHSIICTMWGSQMPSYFQIGNCKVELHYKPLTYATNRQS